MKSLQGSDGSGMPPISGKKSIPCRATRTSWTAMAPSMKKEEEVAKKNKALGALYLSMRSQ